MKIRNKGNRKTNFIFWNFEDQKNGKIGGGGGKIKNLKKKKKKKKKK